MTLVGLGLLLAAAPDAGLLRDLASPDAGVRLRAVAEVERLGADAPDAAYLSALAPLLGVKDLPTRGLAALAVHRHVAACDGPAPDALLVALAARLGDENRHVAKYCRASLLRVAPASSSRLQRWLAPDDKPPPAAERLLALTAGRLFAEQASCRPGVVALLWRALSDADEAVAEKARLVLDDIEAAHRVPNFDDAAVIRAAFQSRNGFISHRAFVALAKLGRDAFPSLVLLLDSASRDVRSLAAELLDELIEDRGDPRHEPAEEDTLKLLVRLRRPEWAKARWDRLRGRLQRIADVQSEPPGGVRPPREVDPQVEHWLRVVREPSADWPAVTPRLRLLGDAGHRALEARLEAADPAVRLAAAEAIYRLRDDWRPSRRGLTALAAMLSSPDAKATYWAAVALRHGVRPELDVPPALVDALAVALRSPDRTHRALCTIALAGCGLAAEQHLVRLLQDDDTTVQFHAAQAVRLMAGLHRVVPLATVAALEKLTKSPDRDIVWAALYAYAALGAASVPERKENPP